VILVTLTVDLVNLKKGIVLTKNNQRVKYESPVIKISQDNEQKLFGPPTDGRADRPNNRPSDISKTIYPTSSKRGIKVGVTRH